MTVSAEEARAALAARLGVAAYEHCIAVAETATDLARVYGVDVDEAYLAALLHDWSREDGSDVLLATAEQLGLDVTGVDREVPYLLHARVGARAVRQAFPGVPDRVVTAIERHTTGSPEMSELDMVVYLADMLEPSRTFEGVGRLREAVGEIALEALYEQGYAASLSKLVGRRKRLHPATVASWNAIVDRGERP